MPKGTQFEESRVSVIIPTRNSARTIEFCLQSLANQSFKSMEIVVVDAGSKDNTVSISEGYCSRIVTASLGMAAARNEGARVASGTHFLFIDSDMVLSENVLSECIEATAAGFQGVVIPEVSKGSGFWSDCRKLERFYYMGDKRIESLRFVTRNAFMDVGGYDDNLLFGEDRDFHLRVEEKGYRVARTDSKIVHDEGGLRLSSLFIRKYRYGKTFRRFSSKHKQAANFQVGPMRIIMLLRRPGNLKNDPLHGLGLLLMKGFEMSAILLARASASVDELRNTIRVAQKSARKYDDARKLSLEQQFRPAIGVVNNGFSGVTSGGDRHVAETSSRWAKECTVVTIPSIEITTDFTPVASLVASDSLMLRINSMLTRKVRSGLTLAPIYLARMFATILLLQSRDNSIQVLVASSHFPHDILPILPSTIIGRKTMIGYFHDLLPSEEGFFTRLASLMYNYLGLILLSRFCSLVFVINPRAELILKKINPEQHTLLTTNAPPSIPACDTENKDVSFDCVFVGRLVRKKGTEDLMKIWKTVREKRPGSTMAIVGDGPERTYMQAEASSAGGIHMFGSTSDDEKYRLLRNSRLFVFPSHMESWGISIVEAMSMGLPVIAYNLPAYRPIFGDSIVRIPVGNASEMASMIIRLLENQEAREEWSKRSIETARMFDWNRIATEELHAIQLISGRQQSYRK